MIIHEVFSQPKFSNWGDTISMKKYFAIFAAIAILGMLALYFVPDKTANSNKVSPTDDTTASNEQQNISSNAANNSSASDSISSSTTAQDGSTATASMHDGTYKGDSISTRFGNVQVAITVSSGKITNVDFLALPEDDMHSAQISNQASPILESQTLSAQSANIDGVSGATYTSQGYAESLQAAIDAAKA